MNRENIKQILSFLFRSIVGFVFLYAGVGKIVEPNSFAKEILNYKLIGEELSRIIAIFLPWLEVIIGIFLIFGIRLKTTSFISSVLLIGFTLGVLSAMLRGLNINCGCFAYHIEYVGWKKILENSLFIIMSIYVYIFPRSSFSIEHFWSSKKE